MAFILYTNQLHSKADTLEPARVKQLAIQNFDFKNNIDWIEQFNSEIAHIQHETKKQLESNCSRLPLHKKFPALEIPHISLCTLPTPVQQLEQLGPIIGANLFFKRDDMTGGNFYGGNKPRKLEFELARALYNGATHIITFGCAGSNHAVATSEYSRKLGLKPICMLKPQANSTVVRKNLLLHLDNNAELHYAPDNDVRRMATFSTWLDLVNNGNHPYIIPTGGSTPLGTLAFVNAAFELKEQIDAGLLPEPDYIYVACGSTATTAGLLLGCKAAGLKCKIIAIAVEPEEEPNEFSKNVTKLFHETNHLLHSHDSNFPLFEINSEDLEINLNFAGSEYAVFTLECIEARELLKRTEGITIDGTYTAKAFAGLLADIKTNKRENKTVLFWNTYCGTEFTDRLANLDYKKLPACFHRYFEEEVQELDRITNNHRY